MVTRSSQCVAAPLSPPNAPPTTHPIFREALPYLDSHHIQAIASVDFWAFVCEYTSTPDTVAEMFREIGITHELDLVTDIGFPEDISHIEPPPVFQGNYADFIFYSLVLSILPGSYCLLLDNNETIVDYGLSINASINPDADVIAQLCSAASTILEPGAMGLADMGFGYFNFGGARRPIRVPSLQTVLAAADQRYEQLQRVPIDSVFPSANQTVDLTDVFQS